MDTVVAKYWITDYKKILHGVQFRYVDRNIISSTLLQLSLEHYESIIRLLESGLHGSAFALLRPQRDAFLRGIWYFRCATDDDLIKFKTGKEPPAINKMLKQVETTPGYRHGELSTLMADNKNVMHDYTHGGAHQSFTRDKNSRIASGVSLEQQDWLIRQALLLSFLTALELTHVTDDIEKSNELARIFEKIKSP
ncbi:conserved hypothetical protein [Vibrio crassostreae]|uniref:DUF6988 family protein n=1 Tax=Vibrio crassostreae TaxID=246167 RepID=UPI001B30D507|nr:hypothetical protein [Vibrio crassostreae]CAK1691274.1 conserved hypothetical protein [Vibrio crassostreae]CAK1707325.1 conserved hypothetical protein [Vibrio crassostreae]CAK1725490.1 conserved hypothetical protein [Vibrio crassostreae]CAK1726448.1 conserved hypothetical protein [Vibrio crassostreae]CAK1727748.1 conserved hypothetical protein [Vibrio crassostreae]